MSPLNPQYVCVAGTTPKLEDSFTGILVSWGKPVGVSICFEVNWLADETRSPMGKPMGVQDRLQRTTLLHTAKVLPNCEMTEVSPYAFDDDGPVNN